MNPSSRALPDLEVELIGRRARRRQAAIQVLRDDPLKPRLAWGLGLAAL